MKSARRRGKGEGTIFQRTRTLKSGVVVKDWVSVRSLGVDDRGKRVRRWFCGATKAEVQLKVEQAKATNGGSISRASALTVKDYLDGWLKGIAKSRSPLTVTGYRQRIDKYALPNIGSIRLENLDSDRIQRLYNDLEERGVSADNVDKLHKALRSAFNDALGRGVALKQNRNPVLHVERRPHKAAKRAHMDAANVKLFFSAIRGHEYEAMWRLGIMGMMRPGELFALAIADIHTAKGFVDVKHSLENDQGRLSIVDAKADSARRIPLDPETSAILAAHVERAKAAKHGSPYAFVSPRGFWMREGPSNRALHSVLAEAGLPDMTMYSLRHTGSSLGAEAKLHPRVVADIMGHADTQITMEIYTHSGDAQHRDGILAIAQLVRDAA